jgi:ATP-binding cassette subfamily A (ABC1) protein 1
VFSTYKDQSLQGTNKILKVVFLVFPNYCLGRGILDTARNEYTSQAEELANSLDSGSDEVQFQSALRWDVVGRNIFCMLVEGVSLFALTVAYDYYKSYHRKRVASAADQLEAEADLTDDVKAEATRVLNKTALPGTSEPDIVHVENLTKTYKVKNSRCGEAQVKRAVRGLSFGVAPGECFGLLGVNGAGKTTTFQMLTGDFMPTTGTASIAGYNLRTNLNEARQKFGYCPQFDALCDLLTGRELLSMYARVRGIPEARIPTIVSALLRHMQLERWQDRVTQSLVHANFTRARGVAF